MADDIATHPYTGRLQPTLEVGASTHMEQFRWAGAVAGWVPTRRAVYRVHQPPCGMPAWLYASSGIASTVIGAL